jgi:class 3 adenylate cyclase
VELSEVNISGLEEDSKQNVKATLFNEGKCPLACKYKTTGAEEYQTITDGVGPGASSTFNIIFLVPVECREPCSVSAHVICTDKQSDECPNLSSHEADVSFDLYDIKPIDKTLGYIVLALLSAGVLYIAFILVKFLQRKLGVEKGTEPEPGKRKMSAIMFTDMKGYSKEMGEDEEKTLKKVWRYERAMKQIVKDHEGRVVKTIGDAIMGDFDSAVNAVNAALEIQRLLAKEDIQIRIGIHVGDVIHKAGDVFGDSVNIASRIESICEPGEIYISEDVYNQVRGKISAKFENLGSRKLKNIEVSPRVYKILR